MMCPMVYRMGLVCDNAHKSGSQFSYLFVRCSRPGKVILKALPDQRVVLDVGRE